MDIQRFHNPQAISMNPSHNDTLVLTGGAAKRYAIPAGAAKILIGCIEHILVLFGDSTVTAAIPAADNLLGTGPLLDPGLIDVPSDITHVSIIAATACSVYISTWKKGAVA